MTNLTMVAHLEAMQRLLAFSSSNWMKRPLVFLAVRRLLWTTDASGGSFCFMLIFSFQIQLASGHWRQASWANKNPSSLMRSLRYPLWASATSNLKHPRMNVHLKLWIETRKPHRPNETTLLMEVLLSSLDRNHLVRCQTVAYIACRGGHQPRLSWRCSLLWTPPHTVLTTCSAAHPLYTTDRRCFVELLSQGLCRACSECHQTVFSLHQRRIPHQHLKYL